MRRSVGVRQIDALAAAVGMAVLVTCACASARILVDQGYAEIPTPRTDASSTYDEANGTIVMFGGANRSGVLAETWSWNGKIWTLQHPKVSPPARELAVMAFDPASNRVVLFGGMTCPPPGLDDTIGCDYQTTSVRLNDTWTWDGHDWSRLEPRHTPDIPYFKDLMVGAAADDSHHQLILLTFISPVATAGLETWTLRARDWQRLQPRHSPPDQLFGGPAFDSASKRLVVQQSAGPHAMCGTQGPCGPRMTHDTTWIWDGSDWQDLGAGVPIPHGYGELVQVGTAGLLLIDIGGVQRWNGHAWTEATSAPWGTDLRTGWTAAYDVPSHELVLFGGRTWETNHLYGDTLGWDGKRWTTLTGAVPSPSVGLPACSTANAMGGGGWVSVPGAPDSMLFDLDFVEPRAGPCHLDVVVHFTLISSDGRVLPITGNPSEVYVVADLTFDRGAVWAAFTLTNACGLPQSATATFVVDDLKTSEPAVVRSCQGTSPPPMTVTSSVVNRSAQK